MLLKQKEVFSITVQPQSMGIRAVYIVETRNRLERKEVKDLFYSIREVYEVCQLSEGTVMSFAIQVPDNPTVISEIEQILKANYAFCILERSFSDTIYAVIQDLCTDTGSRLSRIPLCGICGRMEPFPTKIKMMDGEGRSVMEVHYCGRCVANQANRNEKQALVDLLSNDRRDFSAIREVKLVKRGMRRRTTGVVVDAHTYRVAS